MFRVAILGEGAQAAELARRYAEVPGVDAFRIGAPEALPVFTLPQAGEALPLTTGLASAAAETAAMVDLVDLCLAPGLVLNAILQFKGRARAFLLPCPFAGSAASADRILRAAKRQHQKVFVRNPLPFHPALARALEVQSSGCLGQIRETLLEVTLPASAAGTTDTSPAAPGLPPLAAWYAALDFLLLLAGDALALESCTPVPAAPGFEACFRAESGAAAVFRCHLGAEPVPRCRLVLEGAAGRLTAEVHDGDGRAASPAADTVSVTQAGRERRFPVPPADPLRLALVTALLCLARGEEFAPAAPGRALKVLDLAAAMAAPAASAGHGA